MPDDADSEQTAPLAVPKPEAARDETSSEPSGPEPEPPRPGGGRRLLAALVTLPWMLVYGVTGAWAITRGARGVAAGAGRIDVGYTRLVTPAAVIYVGALVLTAFAVLLAFSMLLVYDRRSPAAWSPVLFVSVGLSAGAAWAAARGGLDPGLWLLFFFGLVYVAVLAAVRIARVTRADGRAPDGGPS
jgi:hypothetical protein